MYHISEFTTPTHIVINSDHSYPLGTLLMWYLNTDIRTLMEEYALISSDFCAMMEDANLPDTWNEQLERIDAFLPFVNIFAKNALPYRDLYMPPFILLDSLKDSLAKLTQATQSTNMRRKQLAIDKYPHAVYELLEPYYEFMNTLKRVHGFYETYLDHFYHAAPHYPKKTDIAVSLNGYFADLEGSKFYRPEMRLPPLIDMLSRPTVYREGDQAMVVEVFKHKNLESLLYHDFMACMEHEVMPKRCKHCGKFYLPVYGYFSEYCEKVAPGEQRKTCREVAARLSFDKKLKGNPILFEYQKAYKTHHARYVKKKMTEKEMIMWKTSALKLRDKALAGEVEFQVFVQTIKK